MSKQKKDGFTLVELLAVIVILAVILVIAVPSIMSTITESRRGALASSAKLIASSAETVYISNQTLGIEKTIECEDVSNYTAEDYASCKIKFVDGKAQVKLVGQGKFEGMAVCSGTKEEAEVVEECPTAVSKIAKLTTASNTEGLITDDTANHNIRYVGSDPKNYIKFNGEDWRIIGIFNVKTASGKTEKLLKIVRNSSIEDMSWDSSASDVNDGGGVNEWSQADLMAMLNTYYIGTSAECKYCNSDGQGTCLNSCLVNQIGSTYRGMIEEVVWNTGTFSWGTTPVSVLTAYNAERGTRTGKECTSGTYCNDSLTRTTRWAGKVGLIYPSDYGYASTDRNCRENINNNTSYSCKNTNWLHSGSIYWTILPTADSYNSRSAWAVDSDGYVFLNRACNANGVRPAIYLKSDVSITSGEGTQASPYQISMS